MTTPQFLLHPDRLLPPDPETRTIARALYEQVAQAPLVSPHGHCEASWFATNTPFANATELLVTPDHYVLRMLISQGVSYDALGVPRADGSRADVDPRDAWRVFASHYHLFRGTPSRMWLDHALYEVLGVREAMSVASADQIYNHINDQLASPAFRPRALFDRFNLEILATTDHATDDLAHHKALKAEGYKGIIPTFRPDAVTNPLHPAFAASMAKLGEQAGEDVAVWSGYLSALANRRAYFKALGATATDHGVVHPTTHDLGSSACQALLDAAHAGSLSADGAAQFEGQMLFEMARMSVDDGLVMQIHAGSRRNYAHSVFERYGPDKGFDIPGPTQWLENLQPLLNAFGFEPNFGLILYTLDETTYSRELAPLAGAFPAITLGAPWWYFDSPQGMRRYRDAVTETAGFYNTAGFVDDTRALLSVPARHDMYRRVEAGNLAKLVAEHTLSMEEARALMDDLAVGLARRAYRLDAP
ncbi:MAG: glucuronate isomerase [Devosiaceae bacterium]